MEIEAEKKMEAEGQVAGDGSLTRLVRLWEIEDADLTDDQLSAIITERYAPPLIPKCRICGADLECGASGGGQPSRWYCSNALAVENRDWDHYGNSLWEDRKQGGDPRVMELLRRYQANKALS